MKTPQQVFKLMLDEWDDIIHYKIPGICSKLESMSELKEISSKEEYITRNFLLRYNKIAVRKFKANPNIIFYNDTAGYWWDRKDQISRKEFVKYLSEL